MIDERHIARRNRLRMPVSRSAFVGNAFRGKERPALRVTMTLAVVALSLAGNARMLADEATPVELRPYVVTLDVEFASGAEFPDEFRRHVRQEARRLIERTIGERWRLTGNDAATDAARVEPSGSQDAKTIALTVGPRGPSYVVTAREWDGLTSTFGPRRSTVAATRADLGRSVATSAIRVFRPLAVINLNEDGSSRLTLRAAGIPTPDPEAGNVEQGAIFLPYLRKFDRGGALVETRAVPFTLLRATAIGDDFATAEVHSALRSPLGGRRGNVEAWCIAASASHAATRLTIVRREDGVPLAGRVVEIRNDPFQPGQEEPKPAESLLTDRSGSVELPVTPERPVDWLTVKSGDATLMRLPVVPGIEAAITLPLGDDQRRLDTEGRLAILTGELIETVAKRATLLSTARTNARAGRYPEADDALAQATKLPDASTFRRRLAAVETPAAKAAEDDGDRLAAARIRALGRKAAGLVDRYLNPDALRATREEVDELKRTDPNRK